MTREEAIILIERAANELREMMKTITMPTYAAEQLQQEIDAHEIAISALRQQETVTKCHDLYDEDGGEIYQEQSVLTLDDAIAHLDDTLSDTSRKWSCESCNMEHEQLRAWLAELRDIKEKRNESLTLDELRQMDGEPVWIVEYPDWGHWELSECAEDYVLDRDEDFYGMKYDDPDGRYGLHKFGWLAYRRKPEEGTVWVSL